MMKSFALFTFFCFSVLLSGWSGCTDFECTIFPGDFDVSSFSLFFLLNADTDYDRLENSCGENWEGGKNDSPVSHSVLVLEGRRNRCNCRVPSCLHQQVWSIWLFVHDYMTQKAMDQLCLSNKYNDKTNERIIFTGIVSKTRCCELSKS